MKIHTLSVSIYRSPLGDCTNGGISSHFRELLVYCPDGNRCFDSDRETPLNFCMIRRRNVCGNEYLHIVPAMVNEIGAVCPRPGWWMNGGNIAATSDSRFRDLGAADPLYIHDRRE